MESSWEDSKSQYFKTGKTSSWHHGIMAYVHQEFVHSGQAQWVKLQLMMQGSLTRAGPNPSCSLSESVPCWWAEERWPLELGYCHLAGCSDDIPIFCLICYSQLGSEFSHDALCMWQLHSTQIWNFPTGITPGQYCPLIFLTIGKANDSLSSVIRSLSGQLDLALKSVNSFG